MYAVPTNLSIIFVVVGTRYIASTSRGQISMKWLARGMKETLIVGLAVFAAVALMLPSFIPDFIPFIGFADEAFWTLILINTANYYGLNLSSIYGDNKKRTVRRIKKKKRKPTAYVDSNTASTTSPKPPALKVDDGKRLVIHDGTSEAPIIEEK